MTETTGFPPDPAPADVAPAPAPVDVAPAPAPPTADDIPDGQPDWLRGMLTHLLGG
jgi:hypothetical protein